MTDSSSTVKKSNDSHGLIDSERVLLVAYKTSIFNFLTAIGIENTDDLIVVNGNPRSPDFLSVLNKHIFNESAHAQFPDLKDLKKEFDKLPQNVRDRIHNRETAPSPTHPTQQPVIVEPYNPVLKSSGIPPSLDEKEPSFVVSKQEAPWTNQNSGDRFFNIATYQALYDEKRDQSGTTHVTTKILFDKNGYSEENYAILMKAAKTAGIEPPADDAYRRALSEIDVGKIAVEIMSIRAREAWCHIYSDVPFDEKLIHTAIHDQKFMPHLDDLMLVDSGFGVPSHLQERAQQMGADSWLLEYDFDDRDPILSHRRDEFQDRFGDMPQNAIDKKAAIDMPHGTKAEKEDCVQRVSGTPASYFVTTRIFFGDTSDSPYEIARSKWLPGYQTFLKNGGCNTPAPTSVVSGSDCGCADRYATDEDSVWKGLKGTPTGAFVNATGKEVMPPCSDCFKQGEGDCGTIFDQLREEGREAFMSYPPATNSLNVKPE